MSPAPVAQAASLQPYTYTSDVNSATIASIFTGLSSNMDLPSSKAGDVSSMAASASSRLASLKNSASTSSGSASSSASQSSTLQTVTTSTSPSSIIISSTAAVVTSPSSAIVASSTSAASVNSISISSSAAAVTSAVASSAANNATNDLTKESSSMSSPGMQAAVAVPVVVVVLAAIAFIFVCMRRRKKRAPEHHDENEKASPVASRKKNWTRHLRVFSFDTELLMGGRYSSTNSIRSRQTGSLRSANRSQHSESPSIHSVDEVAPPYRDAITATRPPNIAQVIDGTAAGIAAATTINRSASNATAPPPYGAAAGRLATPTSARSERIEEDPFADNSPISPVEASPFGDPPGTTPSISRNSSLYHTDRDDASTIGGGSEVASIRQATIARNASVMSGGRIIENAGRVSQ